MRGNEDMSQLTASEIALKDLGREIERIRREAAEQFKVAGNTEQEPANMRATLSNLLIVICEPCAKNTRMQIDAIIDTLAVQHPSRFFVVRCQTSENDHLTAETRSRCVQARSGAGICTEEVYLGIPASRADVVPNLLLSLLVPDIETVLLLLHDIEDLASHGFSPMVDSLASMVDVLMYDSATFSAYHNGIESIIALLAQEPSSGFQGAIARDVAWLRIKRWQELVIEQFVAQQFVPVPGEVRQLGITQYSLQQNRQILSPESALLLAWCLDCLHWSVCEAKKISQEKLSIRCENSDGQETSIVIETLETACPSELGDHIESVRIAAGAGAGSMEVSILRELVTQSAEVSVSVTADGSGSLQSCDYSVRRVPFTTPSYSEIISSRIGTQRIHSQRERCVQLAQILSEVVLESS